MQYTASITDDYLNLQVRNVSNTSQKLDFNDVGNLINPFECDSVQVKRFVIPNSALPLLNFENDKYTMKMEYMGYSFSANVLYTDVGVEPTSGLDPHPVYSMSHFIRCFNDSIVTIMQGLDAVYFAATSSHIPTYSAGPTFDYPRVLYNVDTQMFSMVALTSAFSPLLANPINLSCDLNALFVLHTMPIRKSINTSNDYIFDFYPTVENTYLTNYTKIDQECYSFDAFIDVAGILITTNLPVKNEIISAYGTSAGQQSMSILQDYKFNFNNGIRDFLTPIVYNAPTENYRRIECKGKSIYAIKCQMYIINKDGVVKRFWLPPQTEASIKLHFTKKR